MTEDKTQLEMMKNYMFENMKNTATVDDIAEILRDRNWNLADLEVLHEVIKEKIVSQT